MAKAGSNDPHCDHPMYVVTTQILRHRLRAVCGLDEMVWHSSTFVRAHWGLCETTTYIVGCRLQLCPIYRG